MEVAVRPILLLKIAHAVLVARVMIVKVQQVLLASYHLQQVDRGSGWIIDYDLVEVRLDLVVLRLLADILLLQPLVEHHIVR